MKIGIFWFGSFNETVRIGVENLQKQSKGHGVPAVELFVQGESAQGAHKIGAFTPAYPYETVNAICYAYHKAIEYQCNYVVIHFGNAILLSLKKLAALLKSPEVQKAVFSFRIAEICGVGQRGSPRLPLIDENFIILNCKLAGQKKVFERKLIHASHFSRAGYHHAILLSFIEYALTHDEIANHFDPTASFDRFGNNMTTIMEPFHLCTKTGCLVAYPELDRRITPLIRANIEAEARGEEPKFLKKNLVSHLFQITKRKVWQFFPNYELKKTYSSN